MKLPNWNYKRLAIYGGIAAVVVIGIASAATRKPKVEYDTYEVKRGLLKQTVQVTGEVVSSADVDLKFEAAGRVQSIAVKVGDTVKAGTILASLSGGNERIGVQKAQAALLSAQANLDRILKGATGEDIHVTEVTVANAEINLQQATQALEDAKLSSAASVQKAYGDLDGQTETLFLKTSATMQTLGNDIYDAAGYLRNDVQTSDTGTTSQALSAFASARDAFTRMETDILAYRTSASAADRDARSATLISEAKVVRDAAQLANAVMQSAFPTAGTTQAAFDARKTSVKAAWIDMSAAVNAAESQKLTLASTSATAAASVNAAEQNVRVAAGSLESAKASLSLKQAPATSYDVSSARASVTQAAAALGEASLALDRTRIRAPFDGMIAQVVSRVGSTVSSNDIVVKLHGDNVYEIEADVPETDIAKMRVGMKAEIALDAYGDDVKFIGDLSSIDTAQTVIQDVVYYKTRFLLAADEAHAVRTGMTANIDVATAERDNVLFAPQRAIKQNGEKYVRVLVNGEEIKKTVETGLYGDDGLVEIASGVNEGDQVILAVREDGKLRKEQ